MSTTQYPQLVGECLHLGMADNAQPGTCDACGARMMATASFPELMQRAGLITAPCMDCGAGPSADCDVDCASQFARDTAELAQS